MKTAPEGEGGWNIRCGELCPSGITMCVVVVIAVGVYFADARLGQVCGVNTAFAGTVLPITSRSWTATIVHIRRIVLGTRIILGIDMVGEEELWDLAR
jgi:hypothetical protein